MPIRCDVCGTEYERGKGFHGAKYKQAHLCSQDCYERYLKLKSTPKPPANFKSVKGTERRVLTDYIQDWTNDMVNWAWVMKQAKDIQEEYELTTMEMYGVLKYCKEYEGLDWNMEYGLYQFFPRYIKPMREFTKKIKQMKNTELKEDEIKYIRKPKTGYGKVEF